ncbi:MAG: LPS assembly lipoprotein LptE [Verrucomicrobiota bacterium]
MKSLIHLSFPLLCLVILSGCAGYQLGNVPYAEMKGVEKIYVPVVHNQTYEPGIQVMVTNAIIRRFNQDGTYETGRLSEADATLEIVLTEFKRDSLRRARSNSLVTEEYRLNLHAIATLTNHRTGQKLFDQEVIIGDTSIYVNENRFQENERQAMPLAAEALAYEIVRRVTEGW